MRQEAIEAAQNRLFLYDKPTTIKDIFKGDKYLETNDARSTWSYKARHSEALRYYLLLTCFDILGQKKKYIDFNKWINDATVAFTNPSDTTVNM